MPAELVLGCDPGATGAFAFLTPAGDLLGVEDMPVDVIQSGAHKRSRLSRPRLLAILRQAAGAHAFIEQPTYRPMKKRNMQTGEISTQSMGSMGSGAFGENYGAILMGLTACNCQITEVRPGVWGRAIGLTTKPDEKGKDASLRRAAELFPVQAGLFSLKKHNGRSDAALIGYYGARVLRGEGIRP